MATRRSTPALLMLLMLPFGLQPLAVPAPDLAIRIRALFDGPAPEEVMQLRDATLLVNEVLDFYDGRAFRPVWIMEAGLRPEASAVRCWSGRRRTGSAPAIT